MIPLNFQPVSDESLNLLSLDGISQPAQGKSNAAPVEISFSSYMERTAEADSTDGNNQTQQLSLTEETTQDELGVDTAVDTIDVEIPAAGEKMVVFENQLARMNELAVLPENTVEIEPFSMEISFDEESELYSSVQIEFLSDSENDFDSEIDRFLGFSEENSTQENETGEELQVREEVIAITAENAAAAVSLPSQPVFKQSLNSLAEKNDETLPVPDGAKKASKVRKSSAVMDSIEIVDERTVEGSETAETGKNVTMTSFDGKNSAEMSLNLGQNAERQYFQDNQTGAYTGNIEAGITRTDFASMISEEIKSNAGEFVKTGSIVLQNNNKGSINLILHPEQLGNVKIRLELSDNQITGKIVVASKEAYDAFRQSMDELKQAFVASGFETNGFDLTWTGSQGSNQQGNPENQNRLYENLNAAIARQSSDSYMDNMPEETGGGADRSTTYINLVA